LTPTPISRPPQSPRQEHTRGDVQHNHQQHMSLTTPRSTRPGANFAHGKS
jgi:hypothetical protein